MSVVRGLPRVFREARAILAESIVWDPDAGDVLWCDITAGLLHRSPLAGAPDGSTDTVITLPPPLASFYPARGGGFVASLGDRIVQVAADGSISRVLAQIGHAHDGLRMNEGKVDPAGRWVTGSMDMTTGDADGAIYSIEASSGPDGDVEYSIRKIHDGLAVANGFEWTADGTSMYFGDTGAKTIYRGSYTATGEVRDVQVFRTGEDHDGLTIDAEGCLWSAVYGAGKVVRYSPDGTELETVELPVPNLTSVAFGGDDLSVLFIASARENLTEQQLEEHPLSGSIFAVRTSTYGKRPHSFGLVDTSALKEEWKETA